MAVATFDTLKYFTALKEAGVPEPQARAQVDVLSDALAVNFKDLVTKDDLRAVEDRLNAKMDLLRAEMGQLRSEFQSDIKLLRSDFQSDIKLLRWMIGGAFVLLVSSVGGAIFMLSRVLVRLP